MRKIKHLSLWVLFVVCSVGVGCSGVPEDPVIGGSPIITAGTGSVGGVGPTPQGASPDPTTPPELPPDPQEIPPDPPSTEPPPQNPPTITCPGNWDEDFVVQDLRIYFYTGKRRDAWTDQPVYLQALGGDYQPEWQVLSEEESKTMGKTTWGSLDVANVSLFTQSVLTAHSFSKMMIRTGHMSGGDSPWFLGGLLVEGLKKGCFSQKPDHWTPLYFNPFVRTWIETASPMIVSRDDAVAVFEVRVGTKDDAGSDDTLYGATPFEDRDDGLIQITPKLDYENTDDFEGGRTYYYGRTYFAEPQSWFQERRLTGRFHELTETIGRGFQVALQGSDGVYFNLVRAYLVQPKIDIGSVNPFWGYQASRLSFWIDYCGFFSCGGMGQEILITEHQYPNDIQNFGESPPDTTALGFLNWAIQYDNPGDNVVTGGW